MHILILVFSGHLFIKITSDLNANIIGILFQAIREMEAKTLIRFKMHSNEKDVISIYPGGGCSSSIGRQGGIQLLSLAENCNEMGTIMHEFMHALGVAHTQSRSDRDEYVTIIRENIIAEDYHNFERKMDYAYRYRDST